ncbi:MAG: hypothetical protein Q8K86_08375 [Candidatus Nanopelagicaceae bacterium]|nr:hypothetical protein [Candidatus Nanopelagicaceae bacterium]
MGPTAAPTPNIGVYCTTSTTDASDCSILSLPVVWSTPPPESAFAFELNSLQTLIDFLNERKIPFIITKGTPPTIYDVGRIVLTAFKKKVKLCIVGNDYYVDSAVWAVPGPYSSPQKLLLASYQEERMYRKKLRDWRRLYNELEPDCIKIPSKEGKKLLIRDTDVIIFFSDQEKLKSFKIESMGGATMYADVDNFHATLKEVMKGASFL